MNTSTPASTTTSTTSSSTSPTSTTPSSSTGAPAPAPTTSSLWQRLLQGDSPTPLARFSAAWWREQALVCTVFAITGSSSLYIVRPALSALLGLEGTLLGGPWSYRIACIVVLMPAYSTMLVLFGTLAGRHQYFKRVALRTWGRLLPRSFVDKHRPKSG